MRFLRGRAISSACVCYNLCRGDGDLRMGGIRASVSYATPPYSEDVVCVFVEFTGTASSPLANLVVPLFLIAPPYSSNRRGDFFFLPIHHHVIIACLPSADVALICPCGCLAIFFRRFHTGPLCLPRPAVPHPSHPYPLTLPMMSSPHRLAHRLALRALIAPRPASQHAGR